MSIPLSPPQYSKHNFFYSLGIIIAVISLSETLVMLLLDATQQWGIDLASTQNGVLGTILLTALSTPLLWFLALRPLTLQIAQEQTTSNRELLETLENHVLISISDVQGRIVYANDMFCKVSGYTQNELIGQDHRLVNSGHHDQDHIRNMWRTIAGGHVWRGEFCNRRKDGELYWVDSTIAPVPDKTGKLKQYISIRRDTSTRKANELKLTALKRALDASSEMILITNAEGLIQYANPALCQFTGWTEDALMRQKPFVLDSPAADQQVLSEMQNRLRCSQAWSGRLLCRRRETTHLSPKKFEKTLGGGGIIRGETPNNKSPHTINWRRPAGQASLDKLEYWAKTHITPILMENGTLSGYVQIQHDVSKLVAEEAALQIETDDTAARLAISEVLHQNLSLEQRFVQVLDILFSLKTINLQRQGGVLLRAQDGDVLEMFVEHCRGEFIRSGRMNSPLHEGLCGQVAVSRKLAVVDDCFCDDLPSHGHYIVPIASGGEILGILFVFTDPYPVQSKSRIAMLEQVGEMIALTLLQHQANASLKRVRDAALQVAHSKTEFLANMSHEIRTPMNGVLGMLDLLQDTQLSREQWDLIHIAANSAESLLTIINDILDFSKLEAGKVELEQIEFNLPDLVEEVCTLLSGRAHAHGLELNCFLPANVPLRWQGDPTRIRQVLTNLIGNAVKFTEQGEVSVKVSASSVAETLDPTSAAKAAPTLRFEIVDTGIGITAETQKRLFLAFSQADSSTSRRYGGTGLGLSISKDLVELMNGEIGVESTLGQGSTFWFTLPLVAMDSDAPSPQADFAGKRAMIVDNNATNRMVLTHYLSNWGFTLSEANNGPAALVELEAAVLRNEPYDLLLSDRQMPDMDGFALARAMIEQPAIADMPRILLSSGSIGAQVERLALGYAQSLLKPVRQSQLFDAVIDALQLPGQKTAPAAKVTEVLLNYRGKRILVVEDNKVNQKVILSQLAKFQLKPDLADNGQAALELLGRQTYDLVLMDCQMPIMDGYEATRTLREREITVGGNSPTPIAALTAHALAEEREKCLSAGMDDYLSKPVSRTELAAVLERWLGMPCAAPILDNTIESEIPLSPCLTKEETEGGVTLAACWDESSALKRLDGDNDLLVEMIDLFLEEAPVQLADLDAALSSFDLLALADAAHAMKGMAGHFCAEKVINFAVNLERAAHKASAPRQLLLHGSTSCVHGSRAHAPRLRPVGDTVDADLQLMTRDLTQATVELVKNLQVRKEHKQ
ncbi:response regulator [Methylobacter svalbardensis]|uniref:response regulator n=1 Tax=Methylobacter svalbardensis TaxID=3080016 RepID=UPI0030EE1929